MRIFKYFSLLSLIVSIVVSPLAHSQEAVKKPNVEQIMFCSTIINANPATDRAKANELERWIAGELTAPKMSKATDKKGAIRTVANCSNYPGGCCRTWFCPPECRCN